MTDLQALKQQLTEKLAAKEVAEKVWEHADDAYEMALETWKETVPDLVKARGQSDDALKVAKDEWKAARTDAAKQLTHHFEESPVDKDIVEAFDYRKYIKPVYEDNIKFIRAVIESGMLWLLKPDEKAIETFVKGSVVLDHMPQKIINCLPALGVRTEIKATISDKNLKG